MLVRTSLRFKCLLIGVLFIMVVAACSRGRENSGAQSMDGALDLFGISKDCDDTLCWQNIRPNEQLPADFRDVFDQPVGGQRLSLEETESSYTYEWRDVDHDAWILVQTDKQHQVQLINLWIPNSRVSMAELFDLLGEPDRYAAAFFYSPWRGGGINYGFIFPESGVAVKATEIITFEVSSEPDSTVPGYADELLPEIEHTFIADEVLITMVHFIAPEPIELIENQLPIGFHLSGFKDWLSDNKILVRTGVFY